MPFKKIKNYTKKLFFIIKNNLSNKLVIGESMRVNWNGMR